MHCQAARWRDLNPATHWAQADRLVREKQYAAARFKLARGRPRYGFLEGAMHLPSHEAPQIKKE